MVTNAATPGWAVIDLSTFDVVGDRLYPSEEAALAAAEQRRRQDTDEARARLNFDEELMVYEERSAED